MSIEITANELKIRGVTVIEEVINENDGAIITIRGVEKYIVLRIDDYNKLREFKLEKKVAYYFYSANNFLFSNK